MKILYFILAVAICIQVNGQNLVPNPSFEEFKYCPTTYNQTSLTIVEDWRQASDGTPDYFNSCSQKAGVPDNVFGNQPAKAGEGYAGMVTYASSKRNYREYLRAALTRKLSAGEMVCVELFVSPADDSRFITDGIGVTLSKKHLKFTTDKVLDVEPTIQAPPLYLVDGYQQWTLISNIYKAEGGERYLTIGNFKTDGELNVLMRTTEEEIAANNWAYVYVDSVVVKPIKTKQECSCTYEILENTVTNPPKQLEENIPIRLESVLFNFDEDNLTAEAREKLSRVSAELIRNSYLFIQINGHTDIVGREGYNKDLSKRRAEAVQRFLLNAGIDISRLRIDYHGSTNPIAENDTSEGRAQNRRVAFEVLEQSYEYYSKPE